MRQILLVDDDAVMHTLVKGVLTEEMSLISCYSLSEAQKFIESGESVHLAIIDRKLPDGDGLTLCTNLRGDSRLKTVPIIFLSTLDEESDKVSGLYAGADDYIAKPCSSLELRARIQARLRGENKVLSFGQISIDLASHRVFVKKESLSTEVDLTRREFKLLSVLLQNPERLLSREALLTKVWGDNTHVTDRVVDTSISHLRKKISGAGVSIEALRGEGYRATLEVKRRKSQAA